MKVAFSHLVAIASLYLFTLAAPSFAAVTAAGVTISNPESFTVAPFQVDLGTLNSVEFHVALDGTTSLDFGLSSDPHFIDVAFRGSVLPSELWFTVDGHADPGEPDDDSPGFHTHHYNLVTSSPPIFTSAAALMAFSGSSIEFDGFAFDVLGTHTHRVLGFSTDLSVEVLYDYTPANTESVVPEPGSMIVWSVLGMCFAFAGYRRRRVAVLRSAALHGLLVLAMGNSASAAITVTFTRVHSDAVQSNPPASGTENFDGLSNATALALAGETSSTTTGSYSTLGNGASFVSTVLQSRSGELSDVALGYFTVEFTTDEVVPYQIGGNYTTSAGFTYLYGHLFDVTASTYLYNRVEQGPDGPVTYAWDGSASSGSLESSLLGSASGTLLAGHTYQWHANSITRADPADGGATAYGSASLLIGDAIEGSVPEPASLIVWSVLGIVGVVAYRRRGRVA